MFDTIAAASAWSRFSRRSTTAPPAHVYYVSSVDGAQILLLVGPFGTERDAALWVDTAQDLLLSRGEIEAALGTRVTRLMPLPSGSRPGDLNTALGVRLG